MRALGYGLPPRSRREARLAGVLAGPGGRSSALQLLVLLVVSGICGCAREESTPGAGRVNRNPNLLVLYATCGLIPAVELARSQFEAGNPGKTVNVISGHPGELVARVERGDVPDLLLFLGETELGLLKREGHVDFLEVPSVGDCRLAVAVPRDLPVTLRSPKDLLRADVASVAMASPGAASVASDAKSVLERAKLWEHPKLQNKLVLYEDPQQAIAGLLQGKARAAILYNPCPALAVTEGAQADALRVALALTGEGDRPVRVKAGIHKRSPNSGLARRFVKLLGSDEVAAQLGKGALGSAAQGPPASP